jgi:hypothetical protein
MWEENYHDWTMAQPKRVWRWKARTVDELGNLGPTTEIADCWTGAVTKSTDATVGDDTSSGGDRPQPQPIQAGYCYPINLAHDYYAADAIDLGDDRNPLHDTAIKAYALGYWGFNMRFQWIHGPDPLAPEFSWAVNTFDDNQQYLGDSITGNVAVIGDPDFRSMTTYNQASYVNSGYEYDPAMGCHSVFYLLVDNPEQLHNEGGLVNQEYYRLDDVSSWDQTCTSRILWGQSSSQTGIVTLWAQYNEAVGQFEMKFGTYGWLP